MRPDDARPRKAIGAAWAFARGGARGKALRDTAWAALRAAKEAEQPAAAEAARAAMAAAGAAYLHPIADAHQVKLILGSAAHAAHAAQLAAGGDESAAVARLAAARSFATPPLVDVLRRYPSAPGGGGRVGELVRLLDASLRDGERR
ncbi:putative immunity protein [Cellulosimicrobium cellulans]|uniref:putative immunity protein n=1 Tax=Cellulosimicrobium cellulans TaxID=1710 RepID=UPI0036E53319